MLKGFGKRIVSLILCVAMIIALLPQLTLSASAVTAQQMTGKTVDPSTLEGWMQYFGPDEITTEYTGGVWTDKSVFLNFADFLRADGISAVMGPTAPVSDSVRQMLQTGEENFLVALSAIAANQQVTGYTNKPTDTIFVLDLSDSMDQQRYIPGMIQAANDAIKVLMDGNPHNRVGVVLFSGNSNFGNSNTGTATVLLELDHYTSGNQEGTFLRYTGTSNTSVYIAANVKNSKGNTLSSNNGKETVGGTYTQNGVYKAWQEFDSLTAADTVVPAGQPQAGTKRTPAIVLMTDGQPTTADTSYYDIGTSNLGDGGLPGSTTADRITFLNQLTAAWVKAKLAAKYGIENNEVLFYTVGLNTSTSAAATDVLNPAASQNTTVAGLWKAFIDATPGRNGQVTLSGWTIYKSTDNMITSTSQRIYPTKYFAAGDTDDLATAFGEIAETLTQKAPYVTLVSEGNEGSLDGYVTIEDQLGVLMDVKSVKGLVLGNRIFTGAELARAMATGQFGTTVDPQAYGDELIRTIRERLGITDVAVAQNLARDAWESGQLSYTSDTQFSNYIGWYEGADGQFLGHWEEADGYEGIGAPEGAVYINKSYGYLGSEDVGNLLSDMMHVVVMVRTKISTGDQAVLYKIPASLLPTVLYSVTLEGVDATQPESITREAASPLRLLVEVGLRDEINTVNMQSKVEEYVANGGHIHENADGTYTFYTNRWGDGDGGEVNYDLPLTHLVTESHFHPALDNIRYYFVDDTLIYSNDRGAVYNGSAAPSGSGYYYARHYYQQNGNSASYVTEYVPLAAATAAQAVRGEDGWYVPAGTPQQLERFAAVKTSNATGTLNYSWNPVILHNQEGYNSYAFLGNNGKFTVAPAQGIGLSKRVAEEVPDAPTEFTFTVELSQPAPELLITDANGDPWNGAVTVEGTTITLTLAKDQQVYLTSIPTGTTYTVTEAQTRYYAADAVNATGTVAAHTIHSVEFTNIPKGYGDLIVSKYVTHPYDAVPQTLAQKQFTIQVTLSGANVANKTFQATGLAGVDAITTDENGSFTVQLRDQETITVLDLPEGTAFAAVEQLSAQVDRGFTMVQELSILSGTVVKNEAAQIHVVNDYAPSEPVGSITVSGTKTVDDETDSFQWEGKQFFFKLEQYDPETGAYTQLGQSAAVTAQGGSYSFEDAIRLNAIGTYYYKVSEIIPDEADRISGMSYDATTGRFVVDVTDNDVDGYLEFVIRDYATGEQIDGDNNVFTFTKNFVNTYAAKSTYVEFTVDKTVTDPYDIGVSEAGFLFGLFEQGAATPTYTMRTVGNDGKAVFHIPVTREGVTTYILREIVPADSEKLPGMVYDPTQYTVIVTAEDVEGALVASVTFEKDGEAIEAEDLVINNRMQLDPTTARWSVTKQLAGVTPPTAEKFSFTITETDGSFTTAKAGGLNETVSITGEGAKHFPTVTYTKAGTYYYVVREKAGNRGGMTYDSTIYHLIVTVTAQGDALAAETVITKLGGGPVEDLVFTNTYALTGAVSAEIAGTKLLTGRALRTGEFTFELYRGEELVESVTNLHDGSFSFSALTFGTEDLGTYTYTVTEKVPVEAKNNKYKGVEYSDAVYTVQITVSDNGEGGLDIVKKVNGAEDTAITFRNTYTTDSTTARITGTKTWFNEDTRQNIPLSGDEFAFGLYRSNADFSTQGSLVKSVHNGENGRISLSVTYSKPGEHFYILREIPGQDEATAYDTTRYFVRVLVSDDGEGNLSNLVTVNRDDGMDDTVRFDNRYTPQPVEVTITGTKTLTGRDLVEGEFTFLLLDENEQQLAQTENVGNTFAFDAISFENTGVYTYKVIERIPDPSGIYKGVTYDRAIHTVTVTVTDENGILDAQVTYPNGGLVFENSYAGADTHFDISGEKRYNKPLQAGQFTFELVDGNGVHLATTTNDEEGNFTFANIPLEAEGEYSFFVREKQPEGAVNNKLQGITYSDKEYKVTVRVTDPGDGQLAAGIPLVENGPIVFENIYAAEPVQAMIRATKALEGRALQAGEFTFKLEGEGIALGAVNTAEGLIEFAPITYTQAGSYEYTLTEVAGQLGGVTYDTASYVVFVNVMDNGDGTLSADVVYENGAPTFRNTYEVTGQVQLSLEGIKVLEGRKMNEQDIFTFELKDASGQLLATAENAEGLIRFPAITLDTLGLHTFTVTEQIPADAINGVKNGIIYSAQVYTVEVTARDDGAGQLTADAPVITCNGVSAEQIVFVNTYEPQKLPFRLEIQKILQVNSGAGVSLDNFKFQVWSDQQLLQELTADAEGKAVLELVAGKEDIGNTYRLKVVEVNTQVRGVTYSTVEHMVEITVGQQDDGAIYLDMTLNGNPVQALQMSFTNIYDQSVTPNTGDEFQIGLFIGLMGASAIGLAVLLLAKKKELITQ